MAMLRHRNVRIGRYLTPVVDSKDRLQALRDRVREYERIYEMPSGQMLKGISSGKERETAEVLAWMQAFHELRLLGSKTRTTGTRSIATARSTSAASRRTRS